MSETSAEYPHETQPPVPPVETPPYTPSGSTEREATEAADRAGEDADGILDNPDQGDDGQENESPAQDQSKENGKGKKTPEQVVADKRAAKFENLKKSFEKFLDLIASMFEKIKDWLAKQSPGVQRMFSFMLPKEMQNHLKEEAEKPYSIMMKLLGKQKRTLQNPVDEQSQNTSMRKIEKALTDAKANGSASDREKFLESALNRIPVEKSEVSLEEIAVACTAQADEKIAEEKAKAAPQGTSAAASTAENGVQAPAETSAPRTPATPPPAADSAASTGTPPESPAASTDSAAPQGGGTTSSTTTDV